MCSGSCGQCRYGIRQSAKVVGKETIAEAGPYVFMAKTSGELSSGTGWGVVVRVKISFEASSSTRAGGTPLLFREGAVWAIVCLMPELTSSETICG